MHAPLAQRRGQGADVGQELRLQRGPNGREFDKERLRIVVVHGDQQQAEVAAPLPGLAGGRAPGQVLRRQRLPAPAQVT
jgi:hypothetical protein